jgi:hypothetical protein
VAFQEALLACYRLGSIAELYSEVFAEVIDLAQKNGFCLGGECWVSSGRVVFAVG